MIIMLIIRKLENGWKKSRSFCAMNVLLSLMHRGLSNKKCRMKKLKVKNFLIAPSIKHSKFDTINKLPFLSIDCNLDKGQLI